MMWSVTVVLLTVVVQLGQSGPSPMGNDDRRRPMITSIAQKPNPEQLAFFSHTVCSQKCMLNCQPIMAENQNTFYLCPKLRPPEVSLSERFISKASWPWLCFLGILGLLVLSCVFCACWSCCCKGRHRHEHSSREPLNGDRRSDDVLAENNLYPHHYHVGRGERLSGSKYVVDV